MTRQDQSVEGGTAYQARGNITVTHGMDAEQIGAMMAGMAKHLQVYFAEAEAKLDDRLKEFREAILKEFSKPENGESTRAFSDPDFQFVLNGAQKTYARSGDASLKDDLVKLLVQRSGLDSRERVAKILNRCIEISGSLSREEYAVLAVAFFINNVRIYGSDNQTLEKFSSYTSPFISDLPYHDNVFEYLESMQCINLERGSKGDLSMSVARTYASNFRESFSESELAALQAENLLYQPYNLFEATGNPSKSIRFLAQDRDSLAKSLEEYELSKDFRLQILNLYDAKVPSGKVISEIFDNALTDWRKLKLVWNNSLISNLTLTALGKAIGHSALSSRTDFDAPLKIWVS